MFNTFALKTPTIVQSKRFSDKNEQKTLLTLTINYFLVFYKIVLVSYWFLLFPIVSYGLPLFLIDCYCFLLLTIVFHRLLLSLYYYCYCLFFQYGDAGSSNLGGGGAMGVSGLGSCNRLRYDHHLTSELEGDKMVLKITKPPRNKDSFSSLTGQTLSWLMKVCKDSSAILVFWV
jgi:hypothetical protein